jgi:hypothetical protein
MHVQIMIFDGPRSEAAVEASERAGRERIDPLVSSHPELRHRLLGGVRAVGPDGAECVVVLADDADALDLMAQVVMTSELLPGEDPALLTGPDRVLRYTSADVFGPLAGLLAEAAR